jgi:hypothetical protein
VRRRGRTTSSCNKSAGCNKSALRLLRARQTRIKGLFSEFAAASRTIAFGSVYRGLQLLTPRLPYLAQPRVNVKLIQDVIAAQQLACSARGRSRLLAAALGCVPVRDTTDNRDNVSLGEAVYFGDVGCRRPMKSRWRLNQLVAKERLRRYQGPQRRRVEKRKVEVRTLLREVVVLLGPCGQRCDRVHHAHGVPRCGFIGTTMVVRWLLLVWASRRGVRCGTQLREEQSQPHHRAHRVGAEFRRRGSLVHLAEIRSATERVSFIEWSTPRVLTKQINRKPQQLMRSERFLKMFFSYSCKGEAGQQDEF